MSTRSSAFLVAALALAWAVSTPAAHGGGEAKPTRLWYRVFATISISRTGDFDRGAYVDHRGTTLKLRLRSRTAVLLYRQCTPLGPNARLVGEELARVSGLRRSSFTCEELRAAIRHYGPGFVRRLRLVDDVRFDANGQGFVDAFERRIDQPEHVERLPGGPVDCPAQTVEIGRTTAPERIGGRLSTPSAVRDGINVAVRFPLRLAHDVESGSEGGPCILRATGAPVRTTRLVRGFSAGSSLFGTHAQYGPVPTPTPIRTRLAGRFGASFRISQGRESVEQQPDGAWTTRVLTTVAFSLCPRGGRDAGGC